MNNGDGQYVRKLILIFLVLAIIAFVFFAYILPGIINLI